MGRLRSVQLVMVHESCRPGAAHRFWVLAIAIAVGLLTGGCENDQSPTAASSVSAPPQAFLDDADLTAWLNQCAVAAGFDEKLVVDSQGGSELVFEASSRAEMEQYDLASSTCLEQARESGLARPLGYAKTAGEWRIEFERRLADHACLDAAGYEVDEPPSLEAYVDGNGLWSPHTKVIMQLNSLEADIVFQTCPQ